MTATCNPSIGNYCLSFPVIHASLPIVLTVPPTKTGRTRLARLLLYYPRTAKYNGKTDFLDEDFYWFHRRPAADGLPGTIMKNSKVSKMSKMRVHDTDDAVAGVIALRMALLDELNSVESLLNSVHELPEFDFDGENRPALEELQRIRTKLHSGLISVHEILGWVRTLAARDPEGNELECVQSLPYADASFQS
jgi:hypothetical protein